MECYSWYEKNFRKSYCFTEDITDRKSSENIILKSQQKLNPMNTIDGIVWDVTPKPFLLILLVKVEKILGYSAEEWLQNETFWVDHIHPDDKKMDY
jgi:hypothetical protein